MIPFLERRSKDRTGSKAEKKVAKRLGGLNTPASGAMEGAKGDINLGGARPFKLENKCTVNASLSLKLDWLRKISTEALEQGVDPALSLQFVNSTGDPVVDGAWVAIPEHIFREMLDEISKKTV